MTERWVLNTSPVILLARISQTHLIAKLADEAIVPEAVAAEIRSGPVDDPARLWIEAGSISVVGTPIPLPELQAWDLGAGETAVLSHALAIPGWIAILDDAAARKCAHSFSIPLLGTRAIIVRAKQRGLIHSATEVIRALLSAGFRIDNQLVQSVLRQTVHEDWPISEG